MSEPAIPVRDHAALGQAGTAFSAMIKKWRKLKRCSQLDLAMDADVSQRHISFLESGRSSS